ncbi:MAG TPA: hypothetical protein QF905_07795 [Acidimicrobiales bacterium]|nr:hypothetical protein [Acidimicrobiales bacterium]MDP6213966.1 hypothetical protein [Acidimicrobiales bacterium]MDP7209590.1 hypothetical protein [Acidimicrobiales bacterium]HJL90224.1 hypothetical protein [Acidimicrobiales bacterium]HJO98254.1 hypothetical protein [Acidimicrobiales bacterium]
MTASGTIIGRRYRLTDQVSDTSSAEVWRGHDEVLQRPVTVKFVRSGDVPTGAGRLAVTGAVAVYDTLNHEGLAVVVSEWVDAWPLDRVLEQEVTLRPADVVEILTGVAGILADAHALGVPHGSVRPSNVLVTDDGAVHLTDFRGRDGGAEPFDPAPDVTGLGIVMASLLSRCRQESVPPHLIDLMDRLESSDPARIPGLLEFRLALAPLKQTVTGRNTGRWLIAVAALIATVAVASAASRILYGDDVSPDRSDGVQVDG